MDIAEAQAFAAQWVKDWEVLTFDGPLVREGHGTYLAEAPTGLE